MTSLWNALRPKAERSLVYPLNRDECIALIDEGDRLVEAITEAYERLSDAAPMGAKLTLSGVLNG